MALLTQQQITTTGLAPVYTAVNASDTVLAGSSLFLHVKNAGGSADTVTLVDSGVTPGGSAGTSPTVSVPATTGDRMIAIPASFANTGTGLVTVQHSSTASVTAALIRGV